MLNQFAVEIPTLPVDQCHSHLIQYLRDVETFCRNAEPQRRAAKHLGLTWYFGKRVCKSICVLFNTLSARIASMEFIDRRAAPFVHSGEKRKAKTRSRSEIPLSTVSQRFSHPQWRRLFKALGGRPTTTADFGSSFRQFPTPATFACCKKRFKTEVCTCSQFPTKAMQWIKEVEIVDSVDDLKSSSSVRGISMPNFEVLDARIASALNKIIHNSHFRRISLEQQRGP